MSLDELSRKLERGGASSQEINEIKHIMQQFFSKQGIETKTRIPDADAWSDMETVLEWIGVEFGPKYANLVRTRMERFRINALSQTDEFMPSRDEVRDMVKNQREKEDKMSGKSMLERLQSGSY